MLLARESRRVRDLRAFLRFGGWRAVGEDGEPELRRRRSAGCGQCPQLARDASQSRQPTIRPLTEDDIRVLVTGLGDLRNVIRDAAAAVKAAIYTQLGLKVTYMPGQDKIRADVTISPDIFAGQTGEYGVMGRVRGGT